MWGILTGDIVDLDIFCKRQSLIVQFWSFLTVQGGVDLRTKVFILV